MQRRRQPHQRCRFLRRAVVTERPVRIDRLGSPTMDALIRPRADARRNQQIDPAGIARRVLLGELQSALHPAGFIAMHTAGHQHTRQRIAPLAATQREQRVAVGQVIQLPVLHHIKARTQALNHRQHIGRVTALYGLARQPLGTFRHAPRLARGADGIRGSGHRAVRCIGRKQAETLPPIRCGSHSPAIEPWLTTTGRPTAATGDTPIPAAAARVPTIPGTTPRPPPSDQANRQPGRHSAARSAAGHRWRPGSPARRRRR